MLRPPIKREDIVGRAIALEVGVLHRAVAEHARRRLHLRVRLRRRAALRRAPLHLGEHARDGLHPPRRVSEIERAARGVRSRGREGEGEGRGGGGSGSHLVE